MDPRTISKDTLMRSMVHDSQCKIAHSMAVMAVTGLADAVFFDLTTSTNISETITVYMNGAAAFHPSPAVMWYCFTTARTSSGTHGAGRDEL